MAWPLVSQLLALVGQVDNIPIEFNLSETNMLYRARTWTACLTDGDANHYAISPVRLQTETVELLPSYSCKWSQCCSDESS